MEKGLSLWAKTSGEAADQGRSMSQCVVVFPKQRDKVEGSLAAGTPARSTGLSLRPAQFMFFEESYSVVSV
jgi:hypothetical protein